MCAQHMQMLNVIRYVAKSNVDSVESIKRNTTDDNDIIMIDTLWILVLTFFVFSLPFLCSTIYWTLSLHLNRNLNDTFCSKLASNVSNLFHFFSLQSFLLTRKAQPTDFFRLQFFQFFVYNFGRSFIPFFGNSIANYSVTFDTFHIYSLVSRSLSFTAHSFRFNTMFVRRIVFDQPISTVDIIIKHRVSFSSSSNSFVFNMLFSVVSNFQTVFYFVSLRLKLNFM